MHPLTISLSALNFATPLLQGITLVSLNAMIQYHRIHMEMDVIISVTLWMVGHVGDHSQIERTNTVSTLIILKFLECLLLLIIIWLLSLLTNLNSRNFQWMTLMLR